MNTTLQKTTQCVIALATVWALGCASGPSSDPWIISYVGSPDDVWIALHIALIALDYDVESENREDGLLRAAREGSASGATQVLSIDQIMRNDEVKAYVRVASGPGEPAMDLGRRETIAKEFLARVNDVLYK